MSKPQPMTALAFANYTRYRELYGAAVWPNIDTQIKMQAYDPYDPDIRPSDLVDAVVNTSAGVPSEFFVSWVRGADKPLVLHRPLYRQAALGEANVPDYVGTLYLLEGDVVAPGIMPLARKAHGPSLSPS